MARLKPDRFVALLATDARRRPDWSTIAFRPPSRWTCSSTRARRPMAKSGWSCRTPNPGRCRGFSRLVRRRTAGRSRGDATAHRVEWRGVGQAEAAGGPADANPADGAAGIRVLGVRDRARRVAGLPPVRSASAREPGLVKEPQPARGGLGLRHASMLASRGRFRLSYPADVTWKANARHGQAEHRRYLHRHVSGRHRGSGQEAQRCRHTRTGCARGRLGALQPLLYRARSNVAGP